MQVEFDPVYVEALTDVIRKEVEGIKSGEIIYGDDEANAEMVELFKGALGKLGVQL